MSILRNIFVCHIYLTTTRCCCLLQPPKSFSKLHRVHTHGPRRDLVGTSDHLNEHDFDPDDFPASYKPMLDDSQLAQLIHQMPAENNEGFLDLEVRVKGTAAQHPLSQETARRHDLQLCKSSLHWLDGNAVGLNAGAGSERILLSLDCRISSKYLFS